MSKKILIVDDEAPNLAAIARSFEQSPELHYDVLQSTSASRAITSIARSASRRHRADTG